MSHFFISYSRRDVKLVQELKKQIQTWEFEVWVDAHSLDVGEGWREGIDEAIRSCSALLLVVTPNSMMSHEVTFEWAFALGMGRPVLPLLYAAAELHPRIGKIQGLDFTNRKARPWHRLRGRLEETTDPRWPAVQKLTAVIEEGQLEQARSAINGLAEIGTKAARDALAATLKSPFREVQNHAAFTLGSMHDVRALDALAVLLEHADADMRRRAADTLSAMGGPALLVLLRLLRDADNGRVSSLASDSISTIGRAGSAELLAAFHDPAYGRVHDRIAEFLGKAREPSAVPALVSKLRDRRSNVRNATTDALGEIGDQRAVGPLMEQLARVTDYTSKRSVVVALGKLRASIAVPTLIRLFRKDDILRGVVVEVLGDIGDSRAVSALTDALRSDASPYDLARIIQALGRIGDARAASAIAPFLTHLGVINVGHPRDEYTENISDIAADAIKKLRRKEDGSYGPDARM